MPGRSHFNLLNKDTCDLFYVVHSIHVPVISCIILLFLFVDQLFTHSFVRLLFLFDSLLAFIHASLFKRKDSIVILDCIPGISILLYKNPFNHCTCCTRNTITIYANQQTSYIRPHRLCLIIGARGLLRS